MGQSHCSKVAPTQSLTKISAETCTLLVTFDRNKFPEVICISAKTNCIMLKINLDLITFGMIQNFKKITVFIKVASMTISVNNKVVKEFTIFTINIIIF